MYKGLFDRGEKLAKEDSFETRRGFLVVYDTFVELSLFSSGNIKQEYSMKILFLALFSMNYVMCDTYHIYLALNLFLVQF